MPTPFELLSAAIARGDLRPIIPTASPLPPPAAIPGFGGAPGGPAVAGPGPTPGALGQAITAILTGAGQGQNRMAPSLPNITLPGSYGVPPPWGMGGYGGGYGIQQGMGKGSGPLEPGLRTPWGAARL